MRRIVGVLAALAAAIGLAAAPAFAAPSDDDSSASDASKHGGLPARGVVTNPDWVAKPSGEDLARFYPWLARLMPIPGRAVMSCDVSNLGMLQNCAITEESPKGVGFGNATLSMSSLFRMAPRTINGVAVSGAKVDVPVRFEQGVLPASTNVASAPTSTPAIVDLARRLAIAIGGPGETQDRDQTLAQIRQQLDQQPAPDANETRARQVVLDALKQAYDAAAARAVEFKAASYAANFTEPELKQILAFYESPAGQAWSSRSLEVQRAQQAGGDDFWKLVREDAAHRFCAQIGCPSPPAPAAHPAPAK